MENETYRIRKGAIVYKSRPPLDVQIVAYSLYCFGFLLLAAGLLLSSGLGRIVDHVSRRVLLGAVVLDSSLAEAIYTFCMGIGTLFCAWGLMRRVKFAWWFTVIFHLWGWVDTALSFSQLFPQSPSSMVGSIVLGTALFTWLWFRREFYGIHLAVRQKNESE
jgi:lysylphosphatidylglycerol synthetase-like protein (DUF2156 family)